MIRLGVVAAAALVAGCAGEAPPPHYGADPELPDPRRGLMPDMVIAKPAGWGDRVPEVPDGFESGHLVVRPEFLRFLSAPGEAENCLRGRLYNEYALGSRIQYQVRVGERVFIVERLRQQAFRGALDDEVLIGWDAKDSILVTD